MSEAKRDTRMTPEYQRAVSDFVGREVVYCVTPLVLELEQHDNTVLESGILGRTTWACYCDSCKWDWEVADCELNTCPTCKKTIDLEEQTVESLEHWIVGDWFAGQLEKHGEMVTYDLFGLTIWGRTTSGQAISIDEVICQIYDETQVAQ